MKKGLVLGGIIVAVAAVGGLIFQFGGGAPAGLATGSSTKAAALWEHMEPYQSTYLKAYDGAFDESGPSPMEALEAWNEIGYSVTGQGGFWRKTVSNLWFGCQVNGELEVCRALAKANADFEKWDKVQTKISELPESKASRFLAKNHKKLISYLDTYAPAKKNEAGMKSTAFFQKSLASAMGAVGGSSPGIAADDVDL